MTHTTLAVNIYIVSLYGAENSSGPILKLKLIQNQCINSNGYLLFFTHLYDGQISDLF